MLYQLSGGRIHGICQSTVRPFCPDPIWTGDWMARNWPTYLQTSRVALSHEDYHGGLATIPLRGPATDIVQVIINGTVLNPSEYGLLNNDKLFRRAALWPTTNDLTKPLTEMNTWAITYRFGNPPDYIAKKACIELASELAAPLKGRRSNLGPGITSANIQGASIQLRDRAEALAEGDQQVPAVSRFLGVYAPDQRQQSGIWSVELDHGWVLVEDEGPSGS
jgi:hypothetical protein